MDNVPVRNGGAHAQKSAQTPHAQPRNKKRGVRVTVLSIVAVVLLAALVVGGLFLARTVFASPISQDKYQAVFLASGQVYFGKLDSLNGQYSRLTDVFYIQATEAEENAQNPQNSDVNTTDLQLIKLGNEVHGPEDEMLINRDQILFVENLKTDGRVSDSIRQYYNALDGNQ